MKRAYLAGPMRGYPFYNFPAFHDAERWLTSAGWSVASPARMDLRLGFDPALPLDQQSSPFDLAAANRRNSEQILGADAIMLLPGWEHSEGARFERYLAEKYAVDAFALTGGLDVLLPAPEWSGDPKIPAAPPAPPYDQDAEPDAAGIRITRTTPARAWRAAGATDGEVRITDPSTGGAKGSKPQRYDLIPAGPLEALAALYGTGAEKYEEERNWERGYAWGLSFAALNRHLWAWWAGADDEDHLAAVAFHAFSLQQFAQTGTGTDNRPTL